MEMEIELDDDGYPTEETLESIKNYPITCRLDCENLMLAIKPIWYFKDYIAKDEASGLWRVSTGGWSGNEEIIGALRENGLFWALYWIQSTVGGHYIFGDPWELPFERGEANE